jgi:hypothetical protein
MKAKFNSPVKIFSTVEKTHFLATIIFTTIAITLFNVLKSKSEKRN